jgi:hypothetical protein
MTAAATPPHIFNKNRIRVMVDGVVTTIYPEFWHYTPKQYAAICAYFTRNPCAEWLNNPLPPLSRSAQQGRISTLQLRYRGVNGIEYSLEVQPSGRILATV